MTTVRVGLAQINTVVGDMRGNASKVLDAARWAAGNRVDVLLTPELGLTGYPAEDLFLRPAFVEHQQVALDQLCADLARFAGLQVLIGCFTLQDGLFYNAATDLFHGQFIATHFKCYSPTHVLCNITQSFYTRQDI